MAVPILKQGPILIASIQSALTDADVLQLQDDLVEQVGRFRLARDHRRRRPRSTSWTRSRPARCATSRT